MSITETQRQQWVRQLYQEYENISFQYRVKLRPVSLRLAPFTQRWGQWDPEQRCITLAERLVAEQSWQRVLEVLKHEIAHQLVTDRGLSDAGHGTAFQQACGELGVEHWARRASFDCASTPLAATTAPTAEDRVLRRARKLLALSNSTNPHEAILAMQLAKQLLGSNETTAGEDRDRQYGFKDFHTIIINHHKRRTEGYLTYLGTLLIEHFQVKVIYSTLFSPQHGVKHQVMEIIGTQHYAQIAEYVYWFLYNHLQAAWREYRGQNRQKSNTARQRASFMTGMLKGFAEQLQRQPLPPQDRQLILLHNRDLNAYLHYRHPRLVSRTTRRGTHQRDSYQAGFQEGQRLQLHHGVKQEQRGKVLLLEKK